MPATTTADRPGLADPWGGKNENKDQKTESKKRVLSAISESEERGGKKVGTRSNLGNRRELSGGVEVSVRALRRQQQRPLTAEVENTKTRGTGTRKILRGKGISGRCM